MNARIEPQFDEAKLLDSMEGDTADEASVEQVWIAQAHQRMKSLAQGSLHMVPWEQDKARISEV